MNHTHRLRRLALLAALAALCSGCTTLDLVRPPPRTDLYPASPAPDAPLVLAIPGLRVPGLRITQEEHFGRLVELLAAEGIPCRILAYDTADDPAARHAALYSPEQGLAWTRVGPAMAREFESENERRAARGHPPVKRLVLIGYSQGGVLLAQLAGRVFHTFRNEYRETVEAFGAEWEALRKDPEFLLFINALDDFIVLENIRTQFEELFRKSPALRRLHERARKKLATQHDEFLGYLTDPSLKYPGIRRFERIGTPYYPKRYDKIREYAAARHERAEEEKERNRQFFITYAQYRHLLDAEARFVTCAASLFGSPQANDTMNLLRWLPFLRRFLGSEYYQIEQTELGTAQHLQRIEALAAEAREHRFPLKPGAALSIVGANGPRGDGLVDQPSAHLSLHTFAVYRPRDGEDGEPVLEQADAVTLPRLPVAPLAVTHFPEKRLRGLAGTRHGAAYMVGDNPAWPYILNFIRDDWEAIRRDLARDADRFHQFMVEVSFEGGGLRNSDLRWEDASGNIEVRGRYFNAESGTLVWTGFFKEEGIAAELREKARLLNVTDMVPGVRDVLGTEHAERPPLLGNLRRRARILDPLPLIPKSEALLGWTGLFEEEMEEDEGRVRFTVRLPGGKRAPIECAVHSGRITFIKIDVVSNNHGAR
ncbi:MAG: hypothetical protein PHN82_04655 [bacterium]|nr:hypothetical protein [bacterium]